MWTQEPHRDQQRRPHGLRRRVRGTVTVGDGAYSGAGPPVRKDVPAGALVLTEGEQVIVEGWVPTTPSQRPAARAAEVAQRCRARGPRLTGAPRESRNHEDQRKRVHMTGITNTGSNRMVLLVGAPRARGEHRA
ncbi:hypothetical protein QJS66_08000 [Kocuria rhizophila]|nr:hypothetical protein QJS66_08000 [Kocuria rhizophila]